MALPDNQARMTEAEYLVFERQQESKHEFIDGSIIAMTGASRAHNLICVNLITALHAQLRGHDCELYPADMRVKVQSTGLYTYPDINVVCETPNFTDDHLDTLVNPTVLIGVLSPSTERYDRGKKFQNFREIPSLQEYLLVSQDDARIERFLRRDLWVLTDVRELDGTLTLPSIECELALRDVYERVSFQ